MRRRTLSRVHAPPRLTRNLARCSISSATRPVLSLRTSWPSTNAPSTAKFMAISPMNKRFREMFVAPFCPGKRCYHFLHLASNLKSPFEISNNKSEIDFQELEPLDFSWNKWYEPKFKFFDEKLLEDTQNSENEKVDSNLITQRSYQIVKPAQQKSHDHLYMQQRDVFLIKCVKLWNGHYSLRAPLRYYSNNCENIHVFQVDEFWRLLALCHTVMPDRSNAEELVYQAQSPDENALTSTARNFGYVFKKRTPKSITIEVGGRWPLNIYP